MQGFYASLLLALFTPLVGLYTLLVSKKEVISWGVLDGIMFLIIAWKVRGMSRVAAAAGFALYLLERIVVWLDRGVRDPIGLFFVAAFLLAFTTSIRGTVAYHKLTDTGRDARNVTR